MAQHKELGKQGELIAKAYLEHKNYYVLHSNWRNGKDEIDLIALIEKTIVFVEVKSRRNSFFGFPEDAVNKAKQNRLMRAANAFLEERNLDNEVRFDVISIVMDHDIPEIKHIEGAFGIFG